MTEDKEDSVNKSKIIRHHRERAHSNIDSSQKYRTNDRLKSKSVDFEKVLIFVIIYLQIIQKSEKRNSSKIKIDDDMHTNALDFNSNKGR